MLIGRLMQQRFVDLGVEGSMEGFDRLQAVVGQRLAQVFVDQAHALDNGLQIVRL